MSVTRQELQQRLSLLPPVPFLARLLDPYVQLTQLQRVQHPFVLSQRLFSVVEVVLDRCLEQPGIWVRATDTLRERFKDGQFKKPRPDIWLNLDWCQIYPHASSN